MKLESDPLSFLIRSPTAFAILESVHDGKARLPREIRGVLNLHPQTAKEAIGHLNRLGLISLSIPASSLPRRSSRGIAMPIVLRITADGREVLRLAEGVRNYVRTEVRKREAAMPAATRARWLPA